MSFCEKKYPIAGHELTAKELCERVLTDSQKSDLDWIAPARNLVSVCRESTFPVKEARIIKIAILNCFANIEHRANIGVGDRHIIIPADKEAVWYCYNSLYGIEDETVILARKRYLTEMINVACYVNTRDSLYHPGATFRKLKEDWTKSKCEEYISQKEIDFDQLIKKLRDSFTELIKKAESNGDFEEDEKKDKEEWRKFYVGLSDKLN